MKKSILLGLGACALALGGVAALVGQKGAAEAKADSATWAAGKIIYIRNKADGFQAGARAFLNYQIDNEEHYHQQEFGAGNIITAKNGESLYKVQLEYPCQKLQIHRTASNGTTDWQWTYKVDITDNMHNLFVWDSLDNNTGFGPLSAGINQITLTQPAHGTISVKNANGEENGEGYYFSDWSLQFTASASAPYYFNQWTAKVGEVFVPFEGADRTVNPNTMTNLEGEFNFSADIGNSATDCNAFQTTFLHIGDAAYDSVNAGLCNTIPGGEAKDRYNLAKDAYAALHSASKAYFSTEAAYADARERLNAWAVAHGEAFTVTDGVGTLGAAKVSPIVKEESSDNAGLFIGTIAVASLIAFGGFALFAKKRKNEAE